ncbi:oocyte zinc finger protein XlCOF6-like [Euwallacea fornicatus]|uniref:oocyte zinc finger protein XlCOF6-like n=1 Tax=Euwallacea fornicatus TaxID=995702 RepID=UPI00338DFD49
MQKQDMKIALTDFDKICRVCLLENGDLQSIYAVCVENELKTDRIDLVNIFKRYCAVEVSTDDRKPQGVCKSCIRSFCESYTFFERCFKSNEILDAVLVESKAAPKNEPEQSEPIPMCNVSDEKPLRRKEAKQDTSYFSESEDDIYGNDRDDDSDWEPTKDPIKDDLSVKLESPNNSDFDDEKIDNSSTDETEVKTERATRRTRRTRSTQPLKKRGRPRKGKTTENKSDIEDSEAIQNQHKDLICRLCNEILSDINMSIDHYDDIHAPKMEVDECIFCDRPKVYKKRDNLLYHMGLHSKESIKCIPCRKYFRNKEALSEHLKECFKVDSKMAVKMEEALADNTSRVDVTTNLTSNQLSQKVLKTTQYDGAFSCQLCQENLGEIDIVIAHFEKEHMDDLLCIICLRPFTKQVPLFHMALHSKKSHVCRPCRLFFPNKEEFDVHNSKYDHDKSLTCKICGKKFTRNYKKNKHMLSHLKEKNYSCNKCGKTFTYKTSLVRHFKMHFGKRFLCSSCGNAYTTKFMLQRHIKIMHTFVDDDGNPLPKPPPKPVKLQCEFCGEIFTTKYGYGRHIRRHPEFKEFKCKICSFMCDNRDQLDTHMENKHNKHTCDVCGKRFPFESELKTHHRKHEDIAMARFRCDVCGKTARTQTQLKVHYRIHTGERPFSCDICGKSFKQTAHLKVHMFQHTGKMPFKCKICEKAFPFQHVMEIHMRTHTGEKPFQCVFCGNAYHDRTTMQKHQKKKHPDMPVEKAIRGGPQEYREDG